MKNGGRNGRYRRILQMLPATSNELASEENTTVKTVVRVLCYLRKQGRVRRTDRHGIRYGRAGRYPSMWERI